MSVSSRSSLESGRETPRSMVDSGSYSGSGSVSPTNAPTLLRQLARGRDGGRRARSWSPPRRRGGPRGEPRDALDELLDELIDLDNELAPTNNNLVVGVRRALKSVKKRDGDGRDDGAEADFGYEFDPSDRNGVNTMIRFYRRLFPEPLYDDEEELNSSVAVKEVKDAVLAKRTARNIEVEAQRQKFWKNGLEDLVYDAEESSSETGTSSSHSMDFEDPAPKASKNTEYLEYRKEHFGDMSDLQFAKVTEPKKEMRLGYFQKAVAREKVKTTFPRNEFVELSVEIKQYPKNVTKMQCKTVHCPGFITDVADLSVDAIEAPFGFKKGAVAPSNGKCSVLGDVALRPGDEMKSVLKKNTAIIKPTVRRIDGAAICCNHLYITFNSGTAIDKLKNVFTAKKAVPSVSCFSVNLDVLYLQYLRKHNWFEEYERDKPGMHMSETFVLEGEGGLIAFANLKFSGANVVNLGDELWQLSTNNNLELSQCPAQVVFDGGGAVQKKTNFSKRTTSSVQVEEQGTNWINSILTNDTLALVMSHLSFADIFGAIQVCKFWYQSFKKHESIILCSRDGFDRLLQDISIKVEFAENLAFYMQSQTIKAARDDLPHVTVGSEPLILFFNSCFFPTLFRMKFLPSDTQNFDVLTSDLLRDGQNEDVLWNGVSYFCEQKMSGKHSMAEKCLVRNGKWHALHSFNFKTCAMAIQARSEVKITDIQIKGVTSELLLLVPFWKWLLWDARKNVRFLFWKKVLTTPTLYPKLRVTWVMHGIDWDMFLLALTDAGISSAFKSLILRALFFVLVCISYSQATEDKVSPFFVAGAKHGMQRILTVCQTDKVLAAEQPSRGLGLDIDILARLCFAAATLNFETAMKEQVMEETIQLFFSVAMVESSDNEILHPFCLVPLLYFDSVADVPRSARVPLFLFLSHGAKHFRTWILPHRSPLLESMFLAMAEDKDLIIPLNSLLESIAAVSHKRLTSVKKKQDMSACEEWIEHAMTKYKSEEEIAKLEKIKGLLTAEKTVRSCVSSNQCTFLASKRVYTQQYWYNCHTCWPGQTNNGCCESCAKVCHAGTSYLIFCVWSLFFRIIGHKLGTKRSSNFFCDCPDLGRCSASSNASKKSKNNQAKRCLVLYDYQADTNDELTLEPGDIITILSEDDSGWWKGENMSGNVGLFPSNFVDVIKP